VTASVLTPGEIHSVLSKWSKADIDLLWSMLDQTVMQPTGVKQMIDHALREKIPFIGLSDAHVQMGAYGALAVDYQDIGKQTLLVAQKVLREKKTLEPEVPRSLVFYINEDTRRKIGAAALLDVPNLKVIAY
jgi:putative tryptophan/tyrosine transport system substrate-binding protein